MSVFAETIGDHIDNDEPFEALLMLAESSPLPGDGPTLALHLAVVVSALFDDDRMIAGLRLKQYAFREFAPIMPINVCAFVDEMLSLRYARPSIQVAAAKSEERRKAAEAIESTTAGILKPYHPIWADCVADGRPHKAVAAVINAMELHGKANIPSEKTIRKHMKSFDNAK